MYLNIQRHNFRADMTIMTGLLKEQLCSLLSACSHSSLVRSTYYLCILCDRWFDFSKICQISFGRLQQEYERVANKLMCCGVSQDVQTFPQNMGWNVPRNQRNDGGNIISKNPMTTQPSKCHPSGQHLIEFREEEFQQMGSWDLSVLTASSIDQSWEICHHCQTHAFTTTWLDDVFLFEHDVQRCIFFLRCNRQAGCLLRLGLSNSLYD